MTGPWHGLDIRRIFKASQVTLMWTVLSLYSSRRTDLENLSYSTTQTANFLVLHLGFPSTPMQEALRWSSAGHWGCLGQGGVQPSIPLSLPPPPSALPDLQKACFQIRGMPRLPQVHVCSKGPALKGEEGGCGLCRDLWADRGSVKCQRFPSGRNDKWRSQSHQTWLGL